VLTEVPGVRAGHWTGDATGVTVVVFPPSTVGSCEVRGGAPATREIALLDPLRIVQHVDAVVLTGGSAFGLAVADGVMAELAALGRGFPTRVAPVPIVPAAAIFDLTEDGPRPGAAEGRLALAAALADPPAELERGRVGAGRGATVGKWKGGDHKQTGGLGCASAREGDVVVAAVVVVNSVGDVLAADGSVLVGTTAPLDAPAFPQSEAQLPKVAPENTTLALVVTNARATKADCALLAQSCHHGLSRAIHPSHTRGDGDIAFALATGAVDAQLDRLRMLATEVTAEAVRDAVAYHRGDS